MALLLGHTVLGERHVGVTNLPPREGRLDR